MTLNETIAANIRFLMSRNKIRKQVDLERISGVSQAQISYIVRSERGTKPETLEKIGRALGVEAWQLLLPHEVLRGCMGKDAAALLETFSRLDANGRALVVQVARGQAGYSSQPA